MFRCLFLINHGHNEDYLKTDLPFKLSFFSALIVIFAFVLVRFTAVISSPEKFIAFYAVFFCSTTCFLFLHISGKICKESSILRDMLKREAVGRKSKFLRKMAQSLQPFGVRVASIRVVSYASLNVFCITVVSLLTTVLATFR